jgi:hypothetical protein
MVGTGSIWLRIETSGGLLWTRYWTSGFHKILGSSWVATQLGGSREELSSISINTPPALRLFKLFLHIYRLKCYTHFSPLPCLLLVSPSSHLSVGHPNKISWTVQIMKPLTI